MENLQLKPIEKSITPERVSAVRYALVNGMPLCLHLEQYIELGRPERISKEEYLRLRTIELDKRNILFDENGIMIKRFDNPGVGIEYHGYLNGQRVLNLNNNPMLDDDLLVSLEVSQYHHLRCLMAGWIELHLQDMQADGIRREGEENEFYNESREFEL